MRPLGRSRSRPEVSRAKLGMSSFTGRPRNISHARDTPKSGKKVRLEPFPFFRVASERRLFTVKSGWCRPAGSPRSADVCARSKTRSRLQGELLPIFGNHFPAAPRFYSRTTAPPPTSNPLHPLLPPFRASRPQPRKSSARRLPTSPQGHGTPTSRCGRPLRRGREPCPWVRTR